MTRSDKLTFTAVALGVLAILFGIGWVTASQERAQAEAAEQERATLDSLRVQALIDRPDTASEAAVLYAERRVDEAGHRQPHDELHREYIAIQLRRLTEAADSSRAAAGLTLIRSIDTTYTTAQRRQFTRDTARINRVARREARERQAAAARQAVLDRRAFAERLEEWFLDNSMDAHVRTRGSDATTLEMEYILFSRVWSHQFREGEHWATLQALGFKRVEMKDGYDFSVYWTLD